MCGVIGVWNFRSRRPVEIRPFEIARDVINHRGPDAAGTWTDGEIALGHRRLSILDLSEAGRQPMESADGRFVISFNGEIYNYRELRSAHLSNVPFRTGTDTEVLVNLFAKEGIESINRCNGMFAAAIWDRRYRRLTLVRDRVGIKPLYYAYTVDGIAFASEVKALLALPGMTATADMSRIGAYLMMGYVAGQQTMFRGINKLPPGTYLAIETADTEPQEYWTVSYIESDDQGLDTTIAEFSTLFSDAMALHLRADVPLGIFLSGGLDSSAVVAELAGFQTQQLKTFSVSYDFGPSFDESTYARTVAKHFETEHHEVRVTPSQFRDWIPQYVWHMDEPVTEAAAISLHYLAAYARKHVSVVLSGEGADELLGGYDIYKHMMAISRFRKLPFSLREKLLIPILKRLPHSKIRKYAELAAKPIEMSYYGVSLSDRNRITDVLANGLSVADENLLDRILRPFRLEPSSNSLNKMLAFDRRTWLVDNLLIKADKMTMASGLELRVPFLDYRLVEFCAKLPTRYKINANGEKKHLLKAAFRQRLPGSIVDRKKVGFPTPLASMFRGELSDYINDMLRSRSFSERGMFRDDIVATWLDAHRKGRADFHRELWQLVVLEQWFRTFID